MSNVPPKFYKLCRLCLTLINDKDLNESLPIFNHHHRWIQRKQYSDNKNEETSDMLDQSDVDYYNDENYYDDVDDDLNLDIPKRILTCLAIKVSIFF